jgi:hypothetical protein
VTKQDMTDWAFIEDVSDADVERDLARMIEVDREAYCAPAQVLANNRQNLIGKTVLLADGWNYAVAYARPSHEMVCVDAWRGDERRYFVARRVT